MALPTTISGVLMAAQCVRTGPFISSNGNVYLILTDSVDASIMEIWKATDPTSSFSEQDVAGKPDFANNIQALAAFQVADVLHIANQQASTGDLYYSQFSMATDTWVTASELITSAPNFGSFCSIGVRSNGDIIVLHGGAGESVMGSSYQRIKYSRKVGATWTTEVAVSSTGVQIQYASASVVMGASDRAHFFWCDKSASAYHRSLDSSNTLDTTVTFDTTGNSTQSDPGPGIAYPNGANIEVRVPYKDASVAVSVAKLVSGANPTITIDASVADAATIDTTTAIAMAVDVSTQHLMYVRNSDSDLYRDVNSGSGWGTDTSVVAGTLRRVDCNVYSRGGNVVLAYVYDDNGTIKYGEVVLRSTVSLTPERYFRRRLSGLLTR